MKRCSKCKLTKPFDAFGKDARRRNGLASCCQDCRRQGDRERDRKWRAANPEKAREKDREKRKYKRSVDPEKRREAARKYSAAGEVEVTYLVAGGGLVKIGKTKSKPQLRLIHMQTGSPVILTLLCTTPTPESDLHDYFADQRHHGEWHRKTPVLMAFVKYIKAHGKLPPRSEWFYLDPL